MTRQDLKRLRAAMGLTQQALADRMGVTRVPVARWEMGVHPISPMAAALLEALAHPPDPPHQHHHAQPTHQ